MEGRRLPASYYVAQGARLPHAQRRTSSDAAALRTACRGGKGCNLVQEPALPLIMQQPRNCAIVTHRRELDNNSVQYRVPSIGGVLLPEALDRVCRPPKLPIAPPAPGKQHGAPCAPVPQPLTTAKPERQENLAGEGRNRKDESMRCSVARRGQGGAAMIPTNSRAALRLRVQRWGWEQQQSPACPSYPDLPGLSCIPPHKVHRYFCCCCRRFCCSCRSAMTNYSVEKAKRLALPPLCRCRCCACSSSNDQLQL